MKRTLTISDYPKTSYRDFSKIFVKQDKYLLNQGWSKVTVSRDDLLRSAYELDADLTSPIWGIVGIQRMKVWCEHNTADFQHFVMSFYFRSKEDATLFKLFWMG